MLDKQQEQKIGAQSTGIQAGGNITFGPSIKDMIDLCEVIVDKNIPKLINEARKASEEYVKDFIQGLAVKAFENQRLIEFSSFSDPDVQAALNDALQAAARRGARSNPEILQELLISRVSAGNTDYMNMVISESILSVPKLTPIQISAITLMGVITQINFDSEIIKNVEELSSSIFNLASQCDGISFGQLLHTQYAGAGLLVGFEREDPLETLWTSQWMTEIQSKELFERAVNEKCPNYLKLLEIYRKNKLANFSVTSVGQAIALSNIHKVFSSIDLTLIK